MSEVISTLLGDENKEFFTEYIPGELWQYCGSEDWFFYGAIAADTACGAVVAQLQGIVLELRSIYVAPGYRSMGAATELLNTLKELAEECGCTMLRLSFLEDLEGEPGLQHLLRIFTDDISRTGNIQYEFSGEQVNWSRMHLNRKKPEGSMTLAECSESLIRQLESCVENASRCYIHLPFRAESYDLQHSVISCKHQKIQGILLMHQGKDGVYVIDYMGNFSEEMDVFLKLLNCVVASFQGEEGTCRFRAACINEKVAALMESLVQVKPRYEVEARIQIA